MTAKVKIFKAAVIQCSPILFDVQKTLEKLDKLTGDAASKGAKLVVLPESILPAYPNRGFAFSRNPAGKLTTGNDTFLRYFESAIEIPGPEITQLEQIAKKHGVYLVLGVTERDGGTLYCSAIYFSPEGQFLGKHRKLKPTEIERVVWGQGDGSTMPVFDTPLGKLGAIICWENYMPLMRTHMYNKGIQLYVALNADGTDSWLATTRHIALEGRCYVFSCNQILRQSHFTAQNIECVGFGADQNAIVSCGGSAIVNPLGEVIAGPNYTDELILLADVNLDEIIKAKYDMDPVGHYSRPDIFTLYVDEKPHVNVVTVNKAAIEKPKEIVAAPAPEAPEQ